MPKRKTSYNPNQRSDQWVGALITRWKMNNVSQKQNIFTSADQQPTGNFIPHYFTITLAKGRTRVYFLYNTRRGDEALVSFLFCSYFSVCNVSCGSFGFQTNKQLFLLFTQLAVMSPFPTPLLSFCIGDIRPQGTHESHRRATVTVYGTYYEQRAVCLNEVASVCAKYWEKQERVRRGERERTTQVVRLWILGICGLSSFPKKNKSGVCFEQVQGSPYPSGCSLYSRAKVLDAALWTSLLCLYVLFT